MADAPLPDDKVAFYLEHQRRVDEWAAIRSDAVEYCRSVLRQLPSGIGEPPGRAVRHVDLDAKQ